MLATVFLYVRAWFGVEIVNNRNKYNWGRYPQVKIDNEVIKREKKALVRQKSKAKENYFVESNMFYKVLCHYRAYRCMHSVACQRPIGYFFDR